MKQQRVKSLLITKLDKKRGGLKDKSLFFCNKMKRPIWSQKYFVSTFLVNPQKKLGLYGLLNLFQDTAWIHATHLGHGYESMLKEKNAWVLTRQKVKMEVWPDWGDEIELKTWIRPFNALPVIRDFEVFRKGIKIGECTTQWLILDLTSRKLSGRGLTFDKDEFRYDPPEIINAEKIQFKNNLTEMSQFTVRNSDLDLNGHVNNTRYAQWILDSIPVENHRLYRLSEYEVNFIAETKAGDTISILGGALAENFFQFHGVRFNDKKIVFAATLKVLAQQLPLPSNQF